MQIVRFPFEALDAPEQKVEEVPPPPANDSVEGGEAEFKDLPETIVYTEEEMLAKEAASYAKGVDDGMAKGIEEGKSERFVIEQQIAQALESLKMIMVGAEEVYKTSLADAKGELVKLAGAIAMKLAGRALKERPDEAVAQLLDSLIPHLIQQPAVKIFVHPSMADSLQEKIISLSSQWNLSGRCSVHPSAELEPGDCRVEWENGSALLDKAALKAKFEAILDEYS